jgi:hypothetical protein
MASSFVIAVGLFVANRQGLSMPIQTTLVITVGVTTVIWLAVAWLTPETDRAVLQAFYRKVRPAGPGWAIVRLECGGLESTDEMSSAFLGWMAGCASVYTALFATGHALLGNWNLALVLTLSCVVSTILLVRSLRRALH